MASISFRFSATVEHQAAADDMNKFFVHTEANISSIVLSNLNSSHPRVSVNRTKFANNFFMPSLIDEAKYEITELIIEGLNIFSYKEKKTERGNTNDHELLQELSHWQSKWSCALNELHQLITRNSIQLSMEQVVILCPRCPGCCPPSLVPTPSCGHKTVALLNLTLLAPAILLHLENYPMQWAQRLEPPWQPWVRAHLQSIEIDTPWCNGGSRWRASKTQGMPTRIIPMTGNQEVLVDMGSAM